MSSALVFLALLSPLARAAVPTIPGFTVQWSDDFSGAAGSLPDSSNWILTTGTSYPGGAPQFGTWEIETYTANPENVQTDGKGNLQITAIKNGYLWTSSRIETKRTDFMAPAGGKMRIQASLNLPKVENPIGYWPAFWTLGAKFRGVFTNWPGVGEFDIMESINGLNQVFGTLHCGTAPGGPCNENDGIGGKTDGDPARPLQGNFHEYAFEVDRTAEGAGCLRWFLDGRQYHEVRQAQVAPAAWKDAVDVPHFLLLNLAIGGSFPNKIFNATTPLADTTSGGVYRADYVAVYYSSGSGGGGGGVPPPSSSSTTSSATASATQSSTSGTSTASATQSSTSASSTASTTQSSTSASSTPTAAPPVRPRRHAGPAVRRMLRVPRP